MPESEAVRTRLLTLDEYQNLVTEPVLLLLNGTYWHKPITEKPALNSTEIWSFINPTDDTHPIHSARGAFSDPRPSALRSMDLPDEAGVSISGTSRPPEPGEAGWKDTVRADSKMVTRIIVRFQGYTGRYVWHCHILEHEDNEMMRPYEIVAG